MKHTFILPKSFNPLEFLTTPRLQMRADEARWLMNTIVRKTAHRDTDPWGCVRLHSSILRKIMSPNSIADIVTALERCEAIETAPHCAGVKCKGYRLGNRYLGDRHVCRAATDPRLIERLQQARSEQDAEQRSRWQPIHFALHDEQRHVTITGDADGILAELPDDVRLCQDVLVANLRRRTLSFSLSTTGRVFNAISGLKRELRTTVRLAGQPMGNVDLCCSQPALLAIEMLHKNPANGVNDRETYKRDLRIPCCPSPFSASSPPSSSPASDFSALVLDGDLYEFLSRETGLSRDAVKHTLMRDVLAKRGRYPSPIEEVFRREFPEVYAFVRRVNRHNHAELIRQLQRRESWLVIENVAPRLVGKVPVMTLHDAIFSSADKLDVVEAAFDEVFDSLGFRISLKQEGAA